MEEFDFIDIERRGALAGMNPMFGEWRRQFAFEPVSYSNGGAARAEFKRKLRNDLNNHFVYVGQVTVTVTLYLDEQKLLETPAYGDLDNYAKSLLDAIKGKGGLLIDDCQVQRLDISWIDVPRNPRFDIELRGNPDDFVLSPLQLFEMPDGLYYPLSDRAWSEGAAESLSPRDFGAMLQVTAAMTHGKKVLRHKLREAGMAQFRAFQHGKYVSPTLTGFHRTRVVDSGFDLVPLQQWQSQ